MSAGWESGRGGSRVARHEWKGLSKMGGSLEDWVEKNVQEGSASRRSTRLQQLATRGRSRTMPGTFESDEDEDDSEYEA